MNNKKMIVANILNCILSSTEMNFQIKFTTLIEVICKYKYGLKFEKVHPSNGDGKNDGWIPEKNIFFAMYSPSDSKISQINQINLKLESDLNGLCDNLFNKKYWNGKLSAFYLIVNTHDKDKPADKEMILKKTISNVKEKYKKNFEVEIIMAKDIKDFLLNLEIDILEKISDNLDVYNYITNFNVPDVFEFVDNYIKFLINEKVDKVTEDYSRIKIERKIELNNLSTRKEYILGLLEASDKIDKYLDFVNSEGQDISKYLKIKNYVISEYKKLQIIYDGIELYDNLLNQLIFDNMPSNYAIIIQAIVVNIFIKCDIFEKE
mgnify:FL=1